MTVCTFAGHREVFSSTVESEIDKALIEIIEADKECVFTLVEWVILIKSVNLLCEG